MKSIKDFIYDKNDIFIALIIVCIAAFVIVGRIDAIMAYPSSLSGGAVETSGKAQVSYSSDSTNSDNQADNTQGDVQNGSGTSTPDGQQGNGTDGKDQDSPNKNNSSGKNGSSQQQSDKPEKYSVYINPGSTGDQIADLLISVGLVESRHQFLSAVSAAGAESKLKAGNFIIPSNATPAEVVAILTR